MTSLRELTIDGFGKFQLKGNRKLRKDETVRPIGEPKIVIGYKEGEDFPLEVSRRADIMANAFVIGQNNSRMIDLHPVQYYIIKRSNYKYK